MATNEALRLATDLGADDLLRGWFAGVGIDDLIIEDWQEDDRPSRFAVGAGLMAFCAPMSERARAGMQQLVGVAGTMEIGFDLSACRDPSSPTTPILQGSVALLESLNADGGLWFSHNRRLVLLRHGGVLTLGDHPDVWTKDRLKLIKTPYVVAVL